jgi:hypothetical protein
MANDLSHNPLILDTAAVISATNRFVLRKVVFYADTAADFAVLEDGLGREILRCQTGAAGAPDEHDWNSQYFEVTGLELASISAGCSIHIFCG